MKLTTNFTDNLEDVSLALEIVSGNEASLRIFYDKYLPIVEKLVRYRVYEVEEAKDIVLEILMASIEALRDFSGRSSLKTFVYAIARHKIVDYYRKKKVKQIFFSKLPEIGAVISRIASSEDELEKIFIKEKIEKVMRALRPEERIILICKYVNGLSVFEIARKLSFTIKAVESRLFRARKAFAREYIRRESGGDI